MRKFYVEFFNPDKIAIHMAVSNLSPVSIHTLIPAFLIFSIV